MAGRRRYQPLGLLIAVLVVVLVLAIVFAPFLVVPLAILVVFYVAFALSDRARRMGDEPIAAPGSPATRDDESDAA